MKYFTSLNMKSGVDFKLTGHLSSVCNISNAQQLSHWLMATTLDCAGRESNSGSPGHN